MKRVGILYHPLNKAAGALAKELQEFLSSGRATVWLCSAWEEDKARAQVDDTDLILSIGGDGTILHAAQVVIPGVIPVTGVNLGKLGFMTELGVDEVEAKLPALLAGGGWIDERAMLEVVFSPTDQQHKASHVFYALNDMVVARGAIARVVYLETSIDGMSLATYKADGVIVATATGSTGYSLSAGGPILHPQAREFLLVPILPHLRLVCPMVLPPATVVKLRVTTTHQATLSVDGHMNLPLSNGDVITVKHSSNKVRFLRIHPGNSFYSSLGQRLRGDR